MTRRKKLPEVDLGEILNRPIKVRAGDKIKSMSPFEAELETCVAKALSGNIPACAKFLRWCFRERLIVKPQSLDDFECKIVIPKDWEDQKQFVKLYDRYGPPPWPGSRDGLTSKERERRKAAKGRRASSKQQKEA